MKDVSFFSRIFIHIEPVDFRKQVSGLSIVVKEVLCRDPFEPRSLFVFRNKSKSGVKALYWDTTGFALWSKKLEKDVFPWPSSEGHATTKRVNSRELKWLLQGIDFSLVKPHQSINFQETF